MKESKLKWAWVLLIVFGVVMFTEPVLAARRAHKGPPESVPSSLKVREDPTRPAPDVSHHRDRSLPSHRDDSGHKSRFSDSPNLRSFHYFRKLGNREQSGYKRSDHRDRQFRREDRRYEQYHTYYPSRKIFYRIVWPKCRHIIYYDYPYRTFGYVWPHYHRRYIFVSLGGWWPDYSYQRYYWYGWHPYTWYGYDPVEYVIEKDDTYNYYTYNYYYDRLKPGEVVGGVEVPDYDALSEVRKKLEEKPAEEPAEETQADRYFEEGVKAFETGDYATAVAKFQDSLKFTPNDIVLPFTYVQALFANNEYQKAAEVLREALSKAEPQKEGVFYPRGLYPNDDILEKQIEKLKEAASSNPLDANLQLLLGYQLLGIGRFNEAVEPLKKAQQDPANCQSATMLITLLEKLKNAEKNKVDSKK